MAYCTECGALLEDGAKFCGQCGKDAVPVQPDNGSGDAALEVDGRKADSQPDVVSAVGELTGKAAQVMANVVDAPDVAGEFVAGTWSAGPVPFASGAAGQVVHATQAALRQGGQVAQAVSEAMPQEVSAAQPSQSTSGNQTEQFKSHGPTAHYSSSGGGAKPAAKKSKLPLIIIAAGAVVLVAVFALYVAPRFIFHPVDPNEHTALVSDSSQSASVSAGSAGASSNAASASASASSASTSSSTASSGSATSASASSASASASSAAASSASAESVSGDSATSEPSSGASPASSTAASPAASPSYSTTELPTINDFKWMTGETDKGNAPAGVARITDFGAVMGGWKAYMYGSNLERLLNVSIDAAQSGAMVTLDWYYIRDNKADKVFEDTTASSTFTGTFDGGMLDATGSGRITLTAFWEQAGHQYATGSFMWPSGETEVIALVRP